MRVMNCSQIEFRQNTSDLDLDSTGAPATCTPHRCRRMHRDHILAKENIESIGAITHELHCRRTSCKHDTDLGNMFAKKRNHTAVIRLVLSVLLVLPLQLSDETTSAPFQGQRSPQPLPEILGRLLTDDKILEMRS